MLEFIQSADWSNHTFCKPSVGADGPVAVPKISALPYDERLKF